MAAHIESFYIDLALSGMITEADKICLCSSKPTTFTKRTSAFILANSTTGNGYTAPLLQAIAGTNPRTTTMKNITGAPVTGTGTATWAALVNIGASRLVAVIDMTDQPLTSGNTWSATGVAFGIPTT